MINDLFLKANEMRIPISGQFELTARCNLKCKMCYVCKSQSDENAKAKELTIEQWLNLAKEAQKEGMLFLQLTGGEILLYPEFKELYTGLKQLGLMITLSTNATLITPEIANWLGKNPPHKMEITVYGASPETYKEVCGFSNGFERTINGIDLLLEQKIHVEIRTTLLDCNKKDFEEIFEFAQSRDILFGIVNYVFPRRDGDRTDPKLFRLEPLALANFERYAEDYIEQKIKGKRKEIFMADEESHKREDKKDGAFECDAGISSFWITWEGHMLPCGVMNNPWISVLDKSFYTAWHELNFIVDNIPVCKECRECEYTQTCNACPARLKAETGSFEKPATYLCELAKQRDRLNMDNAVKI